MNSGIDTAHIDPAVRPQDDLFGHVNGRWLDSAEIPADRGRYGAFEMLRESAEATVHELIEQAATAAPAVDSPAGKVGALFASFLDVEAVEARGTGPLAVDLRRIAGVTDASGVLRTVGVQQRHGIDGLVHFWVTSDAGNPGTNIGYLHQGGIGLPDRAYYTDQEHRETRTAYLSYLQRLLQLATDETAAAGLDLGDEPAQRVLDLETRIAAAHWDRVSSRDAVKTYTRLTRAELEERTPGWDWDAWLDGLGAPEGALQTVVVRQPDVLTAIAAALTEVPLADWRAWLVVRLLDGTASYLPETFVQARFDFHGRVLTGTTELRARWKRGVSLVEQLLGEAVGQLYVSEHYPPEAAERMQQLVSNVIAAFRERIGQLEWMGEQTRERALEKLSRFRPKIGHPPTWRDYTAYEVLPGDLLGNVRRGHAVEADRELAKIGAPVDPDEWLMTPQTVNAYYHPMLNEIVFPAAILRPPFFSVDADDAVNYGGIAAVIAHEIGHGFDDQGSRYDGDGGLTDWWTEQDRAAFDTRSRALIEQFDVLSPRGLPEVTVNGALTVGENIGDLCGLNLALAGYRLAVGTGNEPPEIDGWTGEQRFFLGWAQVWRGKARPAELTRLLATDPHSPADLRGNSVRNVDAFHEAFGVVDGDQMWLAPEERVRIF